MENTIHFISGLPRAGSTLLAAILRTQLYKSLGEPLFAHDFEHVAYAADAFDAALGAPGLHDVSGRMEWPPRPTVLPPDLFERFVEDSFWRKPQPRLAQIPSILWQADAGRAPEGEERGGR